VKKPNCVFRGEEVIIFDHESAFSNFLSIFPTNPWEAGGLSFLKDHLFKYALKGGSLELERFQSSLVNISEKRMTGYLNFIPDDWSGTTVTGPKIVDYILSCMQNFDKIKLQLESVL
jgi:hypothetical protein